MCITFILLIFYAEISINFILGTLGIQISLDTLVSIKFHAVLHTNCSSDLSHGHFRKKYKLFKYHSRINIQYFFINRNGLCDVWDMLPVMVVEASNVHTFKHLNKVDFSKQIFYIFLCVLFYVSYCMIFSHLYSLVCCTWSNLALCVL